MEVQSSNEAPPPSVNSTSDAEQPQHDAVVPDALDHGSKESKHEIADGEVRGILEVIASTGRFWHDWDKLKSMLSFQLKQVLSEYPDAEKTSEQQNTTLGETYLELVKRLDEALHGFTEGPLFTLQTLCENLLVTSMLTISTDSYPQSMLQKRDEPEKASEEPKFHSDLVQNGVEPMVGDRGEVLAEVAQADIDDDMAMEAFEDVVSSETKSEETNNS